MSAVSHCRLYLITPTKFDIKSFAPRLEEALNAGDVAALQLRLKDTSDSFVLEAAATLMPIAHKHDVAFIVNDRPDLARAANADGVHIGTEDGTYAEARNLLGPRAMIGVTAKNSRHAAIEAAEAGADYVAFGSFFPTRSKAETVDCAIDILEWWSELMTTPAVAIGGITPQNCAPLVKAGADFIAAIGSVWDHPQGPGAAVEAFNKAIASVIA
jgi:thiamine-phosphate pyrophosphorylase